MATKLNFSRYASNGIYQKFIVKRTDGSHRKGGKHKDCTYFVLDTVHDAFATPALIAYASACEKKFPELALDIRTQLSERNRNE